MFFFSPPPPTSPPAFLQGTPVLRDESQMQQAAAAAAAAIKGSGGNSAPHKPARSNQRKLLSVVLRRDRERTFKKGPERKFAAAPGVIHGGQHTHAAREQSLRKSKNQFKANSSHSGNPKNPRLPV